MGETVRSHRDSGHRRRQPAHPALAPRSMSCLALGAALALLIALLCGTGPAAAASGGFARAVKVSAPAGAAHNPGGWLYGVSCASSGDCTAVGSYEDTSGHEQAMAVAEAGNKWARAVEVTVPTGSYKNPNATLTGVSCASSGNCTAVGTYKNSSGRNEAMAATETGGKWGRAVALSLPAGAAAGNPFADLEAVSCTSAGNCAGVGRYTNSSGAQVPMIASEAGGKWARAAQLSLPDNAGTGSSAISSLFAVSCTAKGSCTAVGLYSDTSHDRHGMTVTEVGGTWGRATEFELLPPGAGGYWAALFGVSCSAAGSCTAAGAYEDGSDASHAMAAAEVGGKWGRATELALPSGANSTYPNAELQAVSCTSAGNCAGWGEYSNVASYSLDMVITETGGKWARAAEVSAPAGSRGFDVIAGASGNGVSCTRSDACAAVGSYVDGSGHEQAMAAAGTA